MRVEDRLASREGDEARAGLDHRLGRDDLLLERGRRGDDLERGSRLVEALDRAVAARPLVGLRERVRVEGRPVREREDLAGPRVHDDRRARERVVLLDAGAQLALGDVLQVLIDGELDAGAAVAGRSTG
jgi:hypothetical protein